MLLFSTGTYARSCNVTDLKTVEKITQAQSCMKDKLRLISKALTNYSDYSNRIEKTLKELIKHGLICKKARILKSYSLIKDCESLHEDRLKKFLNIVRQFNDMEKNIDELKRNKELLKLKNELIENATSLIIENHSK